MKPTLIMTRPAAESGPLLESLTAFGDFDVIYSPVMDIVPVAADLPRAKPDHLILTSKHAAKRAAELDLPQGIDAWCVGETTAKAAQDAGFNARSAQGDAAALIAMIKAAKPKGRMLYLHGAHRRVDIAASLTAAGIPCESCVIYDQVALPITDSARSVLTGTMPVVIPLYSPRSAGIFTQDLMVSAPAQIAAISDATRRSVIQPERFGIYLAPTPDHPGMVQAICDVFDALRGNTSP